MAQVIAAMCRNIAQHRRSWAGYRSYHDGRTHVYAPHSEDTRKQRHQKASAGMNRYTILRVANDWSDALAARPDLAEPPQEARFTVCSIRQTECVRMAYMGGGTVGQDKRAKALAAGAGVAQHRVRSRAGRRPVPALQGPLPGGSAAPAARSAPVSSGAAPPPQDASGGGVADGSDDERVLLTSGPAHPAAVQLAAELQEQQDQVVAGGAAAPAGDGLVPGGRPPSRPEVYQMHSSEEEDPDVAEQPGREQSQPTARPRTLVQRPSIAGTPPRSRRPVQGSTPSTPSAGCGALRRAPTASPTSVRPHAKARPGPILAPDRPSPNLPLG